MKKTMVVFVIISLLLSILNLGITVSAADQDTSGGLLTSDISSSEDGISENSSSSSSPSDGTSSTNTPPVANAGGPYSANTGEQITLSASNSYDADGSITGYIWDFNSDEIWDTEWLTSPSTTYTYSTAGTYTAKLQVKDDIGATTVATSTVTITTPTSTLNNPDSTLGSESASPDEPITNNDDNSEPGLDSTEGQDMGDPIIIDGPDDDGPNPDSGEANDELPIITTNSFIANAGKPYYGTAGVPVQFDASGSFGAVTYDWDFGDETTGTGKTPIHTYTESGEYYVTLTITNNAGSTLIDITPVYISQTGDHLKPYGKRSYSAEKYKTITFDASQSTSTDSNAPIVSYTWYFGDGDTATGQQVTHSYSISRVYLVVLEVTDSEGNKKQDVLHADIGRDLTKMDDFFILSDLAEIFTAIDLYSYFDVSIYTNYNGVEKNTPVRAGSLPVSIDVNNDGSNDISVGSIKLLKLGVDRSQFNGILWFVFTTTLSKVSILSGGSISQSDEFTVCLQMSLNKIPNLDLDEKRVRVGYYSAAGEEKPSGEFGVKHFFRPYLFLRSSGIYPEVGSSITGSGGADKFSLFTNFADVNNPEVQSTTMTLHYDPFISSTLVHRHGKTSDGSRLYDIAFQGSGSSAVSLYFTRQNAEGSASLGVLIDPIQNFVFHVDATPLVAGGGSITFRSDELIDNIVLFAKSKDPQGDKDIYFYLKNLPKSIDVQWDPSLKDGFIRASNVQGNELLEVGICNDLNTPNWKINATNLPSSVDLSWDLSVEGQIQLKTTNTGDIALDYYGWRENRTINFHVDSEDDINVAASWNLEEGRFKVLKSDALVNFGFSILQKGMPKGDLLVDLSGNLSITREGEDLEVLFGDFEQGKITINNAITGTDVSVGVNVKYGALLEAGVESLSLGASGGGSAVINWDDTPRFKVEANLGKSTYLEMSKFKLKFNKLNMSIGTLDLYGAGYAEIKWNEASKTFGIGASARMTSEDIVLVSEGLRLSAGSFVLGGAASANIAISEGFSVNAGASIQLGNFDIGVGGLNLKIGSFHLDGSGSASVKKGSLESLQLQGSTTFGIGSVYFSYGGVSINIQGNLDISAGGTVILDKSHLEMQGTLTVDIPTQCTFVINAETVKVQGKFTPKSKGTIHVSWGSSNSINLGATISTTIDNFYFEYQTLRASSGNINLNGNGDVNINLGDTFSASGTISGGFSLSSVNFTVGNDNPKSLKLTKIDLGGIGTVSVVSGNTLKIIGDVAFYLQNLYFKSSSMEVRIDGAVDLDVGGYVEVGDKMFEMSVTTGSITLGSCTFYVNAKKIAVSGTFNLDVNGIIALNWDTTEKYVELTGTGGKLTVNGLNFNYNNSAFIVTANKIEFASGGHFYVSWDQNALEINGGNGAYLKIENIEVKAGSTNIKIDGSIDLGANGYIYVADGKLELQVTGSINLGSCTFNVNGKIITASGNFDLNLKTGKIALTWTNNSVDLFIPTSDVPLAVTSLNFIYDQFTISANTISFPAGGKFHAEWDTVQNSIKIEGGSASLSISNVNIKYVPSLDVNIAGSLSLETGGKAFFKNGLLQLSGSTNFNLVGTVITVNGQSIKAEGSFALDGSAGVIEFTWDAENIGVKVTGGASLTVTNPYLETQKIILDADQASLGANGNLDVQILKTTKVFKVSGNVNFKLTNPIIKYESTQIFSAALFDIVGGGTVNIGNTYSLQLSTSVDIDNLNFNPPDAWSWPLNYVKGSFALSGSGTLSAGDGTFNMNANIQGNIDQFDIAFSTTYIKFTQLYANAGVSVDLITNSEFNVKGSGRVVLNSLQAKYGSWVGSVAILDGTDTVIIRVRDDKYGQVWANRYLLVNTLSITRGTLVFSLDYLLADGGGGATIDLYTPRFDIHGNGNLIIGEELGGLFIKTQGGWTVNIPSSVFTGNGHVSASWDNNHLSVYADVNVYWKAIINTQTYGSWSVTGNLNGEATINAYWTTSTSGQMVINIPRTGVMSGLQITHESLNIVLGQLNLNSGTMTINWNRGDTGYININNPITGALTGLQLTYGTFNLNIGTLNLVPGYGEIKWDKTNQEVQVTNGIISGQALSFALTLNDVAFSVSIGGLQKNSQPIVIRWYKDASGIVNGGFIDTNDQALASLIDFTVTQSSKKVKITLYGLRANDFDVRKTSGQWQFSGSIQLANQLTVALYDGTWHTIDLQWNFPTGDLETKYIKYTCSETITIQLSSFTIKDWTFTSTINLYAGYMNLDWHFSSTTNHIRFDTGGKSMGSITFEVNKVSTGAGFKFAASVLKASNGRATWNGWPPAGITWDGTIDLVSITSIYAKLSGSTWYKIHPLTMTEA